MRGKNLRAVAGPEVVLNHRSGGNVKTPGVDPDHFDALIDQPQRGLSAHYRVGKEVVFPSDVLIGSGHHERNITGRI